MAEEKAPVPAEAPAPVAQRVDMSLVISNMVSVMTSLIGGMASQGSSDKALTMEDLPKWLEDNAAIAKKIIENFPQRQEAAPAPVPDPVSEDKWKLVVSSKSGKILGILPENALAERWFSEETEQAITSKKAVSSYDSAVERCREKVQAIIKDCERKNQKFRDAEFALDDQGFCLRSLVPDPDGDPFSPPPQTVSRARNIFPSPKLFVNEARADDVRQGKGGDCWFLAGVAALTNLKAGLNHNYVQVDGDEKVGVYGFVFHRDGEWIYEIVDDFLYLKNPVQGHLSDPNSTDNKQPNYCGSSFEWKLLRYMDEEKYRKTFMNGSDALYFSKSRDENETWLPLLEKAYAKAHGDYQAIEGGFTGEAIEDLTGGITTEIKTEDILDLDQMWDELSRCNQDFIFGCWTPEWPDKNDNPNATSQGLYSGHAYSIMKTKEVDVEGTMQRLVLVRNPWGKSEWTGPYSDGSKEWTIDLMQKLEHKFGDDGVFWMSYQDLLRKFELFDRTRLIGPEWSYAQCWANFYVPRQIRFHQTKFAFELDQDDRTVISLSQLDDRYIRGLEGPYWFTIEFRLEKDGQGEILARSSSSYNTSRSVNAELDLEKGSYSLYLKIKAYKGLPREPVVKAAQKYLKENTTKFIQIAKKYNLAFMKSGLGDEERSTKTLEEAIQPTDQTEPPKSQQQQLQIGPSGSLDPENPLSPSPDSRGMDNVGEVTTTVVVSTEEPVENPITQQPQTENKDPAPTGTGDNAAEKKDPKDDWDAIATIGLRLLTQKAMVKLSVVGSDKPKGAGAVITSRQSFPVGNVPKVIPGGNSTVDLTTSTMTGTTTEGTEAGGSQIVTPETSDGGKEGEKALEDVAKDETKVDAQVGGNEKAEGEPAQQEQTPATIQPAPPLIDAASTAIAETDPKQPPVPPKRFRFQM